MEKYCGNCIFLNLYFGSQKKIEGWGICELTSRIMHESTLCTECENYKEERKE